MRSTRRLALALALALVGAVAPAKVHAQVASAADEDSEIYVREARGALAHQRYEQAGRLLDKAIQVNPRRIDTYVLRATVHALRKEYAQGIAVLRRARALAPDNPHVLTTLGAQLVLAHKSEEGVPLLEDVVRRFPDRYEAHAALAHEYERTGRFAAAIGEFDAYFRTRPGSLAGEDTTHRIDQANALLRAGDPRAARKIYTTILEHDARSVIGRLGLAWSTAAIDCSAALPMLRALSDLQARYPEVLLVEGRCEMALGRTRDALDSARAYNKRRPEATDGLGLLGDARLSTGDLKGARVAYGGALARDPGSPLYTMRLARVERLQGAPDDAAEHLAEAGAPRGYEDEWTLELGEALYADGRAGEATRLLSPWVAAHATDVGAQTVLGLALYTSGDAGGAILHLEQALALDPTQTRARAPLQAALVSAGVAAFARKDLGQAELRLVRATQLGDDPLALRDLGAVRLLAGNARGAVEPLERAVKVGQDAASWHLLGRAYASLGKIHQADAALRQALRLADASEALDVRVDLAAVRLGDGEPGEAVLLLEPTLSTNDPVRGPRVRQAWLVAARAAATTWMRAGAFERATRQLEELEKRLPANDAALAVAVRCDLALAATGAGLRELALRRLRELEKTKAVCPFVAPADRLAVPILIAWNEGSVAAFAEQALARLELYRKSASGPARPLVREAARVITLRAAADLYASGSLAKARAFIAKAHRYEDPPGPELATDDAVLALEDGQVDVAIAALDGLGASVPEAYVQLGLAWEKKGQPGKALDAFRKAAAAGVRFAPLRAWIATKERLWGP